MDKVYVDYEENGFNIITWDYIFEHMGILPLTSPQPPSPTLAHLCFTLFFIEQCFKYYWV